MECDALPTPPCPTDALSGLAFNQAMRLLRSSPGMSFFATSSHGALAVIATGSKSLSTS